MNIFSVFTLASSAKQAFSQSRVKAFFNYIKSLIVHYVDEKDLLGEDKKAAVDKKVISWVKINWFGYNSMLDWFLAKIFVPIIPIITQAVYDFLKDRIENLTV